MLTAQLVDGGTPATGAVTVIAWPTAQELLKLGKGEQANAVVVQHLQTARDGLFTVRLDPTVLPRGYVTERGQVDLELVMTAGTRQAAWFTSATQRPAEGSSLAAAHQSAGVWTTAHSSLDGILRFDLASGTSNFDTNRSAKDSTNQLAVTSTAPSEYLRKNRKLDERGLSRAVRAPRTSATPADICVVTADKTYYNITEEFATVFAWSGAKGTVDFNTGSDHTLGIAVESSNGWKQSGTAGISTSAGATVTGLVNKVAVNKVNYRDYYNSCTPYTYRKPISFYSLLPSASFASTSSYKFSGGCSTYLAGASIWKKQGTNVTYSAGVPLGVAYVSAQSGWNTETKMTWNITARTKVCGSKSSGWVDSPEVDARKA